MKITISYGNAASLLYGSTLDIHKPSGQLEGDMQMTILIDKPHLVIKVTMKGVKITTVLSTWFMDVPLLIIIETPEWERLVYFCS